MSDRARILIDCDSVTVAVDRDVPDAFVAKQVEISKADLIAKLAVEDIANLMKMSKQDLMELHLARFKAGRR